MPHKPKNSNSYVSYVSLVCVNFAITTEALRDARSDASASTRRQGKFWWYAALVKPFGESTRYKKPH